MYRSLTFFVQDAESFQLDDFKYNFVNMTAFRMVDVDDVAVHQVLKDMHKFQQSQDGETTSHYIKVSRLSTLSTISTLNFQWTSPLVWVNNRIRFIKLGYNSENARPQYYGAHAIRHGPDDVTRTKFQQL